MKVIAFLADMNKSYGKGVEVDSLYRFSDEETIFIVRDRGGNKSNVYSPPLGNVLFKVISLLDRKFNKFKGRYIQELLFDKYVSFKLKKLKGVKVFYGVPRLINSFETARRLNAVTVLHAAELPSNENIKILKSIYPDEKLFPSIWDMKMMKLSNETLKYVDKVICHSEYSKRKYIDCGFLEKNVYKIPMGFPEELLNIERMLHSEITRYVFVGNLTLMKGLDVLLEAWSFVSNEYNELWLCGDLHEDAKLLLKEFQENFGNIYYLGHVNIRDILPQCDVLVFPSRSESFGRIVFEAAALGLPIIASSCGADPLIFDGNGGHSLGLEPNEFSKKMKLYDNNKELVLQDGIVASNKVSNYTWNRFGKNTIRLLDKIHENL